MAELSVLDRLGGRSTRREFWKRARALGVAVEEPVTSTAQPAQPAQLAQPAPPTLLALPTQLGPTNFFI